ncbi:MAG: helix-turn-helix domain-containing protein [Cyanobium sp.]
MNPAGSLRILEGHTLQLDAWMLTVLQSSGMGCLILREGLVRVAIHTSPPEPAKAPRITLAFLQGGDWLPLDLLRHEPLVLQALQTTLLEPEVAALPPAGATSLHDWTLALLRIRHLTEAEQRIGGVLRLLVQRIGRRGRDWYEIPLRLTHAELAELSGHTRVTVTRQLSRWRSLGLIEADPGLEGFLRLAPALVEAGRRG